jgi:fructose-bisphosphate aldolase, class II
MPLRPAGELVGRAAASGRAAVAFNVVSLEHAEGIVAGADAAGIAVILQISENTARYHGGLEPIAVSAAAVARSARVPVGLHLDHATDPSLVESALEFGFGSVMFDAGARDYAANVEATAAVVTRCHRAGVWVEGELGEIGGKDGASATGARTDPDEASAYVEATGVDALAVAVGSSHQMRDRVASLDFTLIERLRESVAVPLVLHGSSGVADPDLARAVHSGITKVNIATLLNERFTRALRELVMRDPAPLDVRRLLGAGRAAIEREVARLLVLLGP